MTVRGIDRAKDQILRRISTGRAGKRSKVDSVDITLFDASREALCIWRSFVDRALRYYDLLSVQLDFLDDGRRSM